MSDETRPELHHFSGDDLNKCDVCGRNALDASAHLSFRVTATDERHSEAAKAMEVFLHHKRDEIIRKAMLEMWLS